MNITNNFYKLTRVHVAYLAHVLKDNLTLFAILYEASNNNTLAYSFYKDANKIVKNIYKRKKELQDFLIFNRLDNTDIDYREEYKKIEHLEDIIKKDILLSYCYVIFAFVNALTLSKCKQEEYLNFANELIDNISKYVNNTHIYNPKEINITYIKSQLYWRLGICWIFSEKPHEYKCIEANKKSNYYSLLLSENSEPITTVYSFRKCTIFLYQSLINDKLNLSSPYQFNDPMDCPIKDIVSEISKKAFKDCVKIACFIKGDEYKNLLMWPHYADSHKGICIKYNFSSFDLSKINNNNSQKVALFRDIEYNNNKLRNKFSNKKKKEVSINDAFFLKSKAWKYENELRLLYYDVNGKGDYTSIDAPHCIEAIYFGYKCSDEDKKTIHKILKDKTVKIKDENGNFKSENIKFYQMEIDKDNFGQIKAVDYNPD